MSERKKIAVILSRFPYPLDKGDKLRAFHQIAYIARFHDVYLYALHEEAIREDAMKALQPFCKDIRLYRLPLTAVCVPVTIQTPVALV